MIKKIGTFILPNVNVAQSHHSLLTEMTELQPPEGPTNVGISSEVPGPCLGSKRHRRPSVRLGDIGDQPTTLESFVRRSTQWKFPIENGSKYRHPSQKDTGAAGKAFRTRPRTNLGNGGDYHEAVETNDKNHSGDGILDLVAIGNWKGKDFKAKRGGGGGGMKRVRSNWAPKVNEGAEGDEKFSGGEDGDEGFRNFDSEGSESPLKEQSPNHSLENMAVDLCQTSDRGHVNERERRPIRARVLEGRDHDEVELDGPSDTEARDWKCGTSAERNGTIERGRCRSIEDGVRMWLNGLGLGHYAPVFEIHEVDDEVLPLLTLEDLKDMGINTVGSRRKMYCAIQKLGKGFS